MTRYLTHIFLFLILYNINCYGYEEPGKYIEKFERSPEREYYKKDSDSFSGAKVSLERDVNYRIDKTYDDDDFKRYKSDKEWKRSKFVNDKQDDNSRGYEKQYSKKDYDEDYKYKKNKYAYPKKYESEGKKVKREYSENGRTDKDIRVINNNGEDQEKNKRSQPRDDPPDHTNYIAMSRYVVHMADWASVATMSVLPPVKGFPFANIVSMSDGTKGNFTGIPYFYLTPLDFTHQDISNDNRCTVSVSLAETGYCALKKWDADDPRCARVMLSGKIQRVNNQTSEYEFARNALFTRHPSMASLPANHNFYVAKLKIGYIVMLDWFGGPKTINIKDYLNFKPPFDKDLIERLFSTETNSIDGGHNIHP